MAFWFIKKSDKDVSTQILVSPERVQIFSFKAFLMFRNFKMLAKCFFSFITIIYFAATYNTKTKSRLIYFLTLSLNKFIYISFF